MHQILSQTENIPLFHAYARKNQYADFQSDSLSHDKPLLYLIAQTSKLLVGLKTTSLVLVADY